MVALIENDIAKIEPLYMLIKIGNISSTFRVDSGSACCILNRSLASQVVKSSPYAVWIHKKVSPQLRTISNELIHIVGKIQTPITSNGWTSNSATFTVVADGLKSLISSQNSKNVLQKTFLIWSGVLEDQKIMWLNLTFTKICYLDTKRVDAYLSIFKKRLIRISKYY